MLYAPNSKILFWLISIIMTGLFFKLLSFFLITFVKKPGDRRVIEKFDRIYYINFRKNWPRYLGIQCKQYPVDNWVMQELITEIKPDFIIEMGTGEGGTALFYAGILEKNNENGKVITVDVKADSHKKAAEFKTWKERVEFINGNSVSPEVAAAIAERVKGRKVLITLDSRHSKNHVFKELTMYAPLVSLNSYMVVQDTHLGKYRKYHRGVKNGGPLEAMEEFLKTTDAFKIDRSLEKHLITQYPSGFLKRVK